MTSVAKRVRIVIVGASLAGATAAATLRDEGFDGEIRLIGAETQLPYNRPPLSKGYLRQQERFEDQLVKPVGYYADQRIALTLGVRATAIDAKQKRVELVLEDSVAALEGSDRVERVRTRKGRVLPCDMVVAGIGIVPNTELLAAAGAEVDNGVLVDEHCRTSLPDVFAAGDVTNHLHPVFGRLRVEHWNNGYQQGRAAARSLLGGAQPYDYIHSFWSDQYEHTLEYVGFATRWDRLVFRGRPETRKFLGFYLDSGIIRAAVGLDRGGDPDDPKADGELKAAASLIRNRVSVDPAKLSDEAVELRSLVTPVTGR